MSKEVNELLNVFATMASNNPSSIQAASMKFNDLSTKPNYATNLLSIIVNNDLDIMFRLSSAIQLKNIIDKQWQRSSTLTDSDKHIIRTQILNCAVHLSIKMTKFYNILADLIAKISRSDWNQKWPNLFHDLFSNDTWLVIYRVCQVQSTRRLSQGIVLFKELALAMSSQILLKWENFLTVFETKYSKQPDDSSCLLDFFNISYQLRTMCLFINYTHLIANSDYEFCNVVNNLFIQICSYFPNLLKCYQNSVSIMNEIVRKYFYKFLKSMIWVMLSYQNKNPNKSIRREIENLSLVTIFESNDLYKSEKLTLLILNLLLNTLNKEDKSINKTSVFDLQIINLIRSKFLVQLDGDVEKIDNDPEVCMETFSKEDGIILYKLDDVVDELLTVIVRSVFRKNLNGIMEMIQIGVGQLNSMNMPNLESFLHLIGIVIQSCYYADNCNTKKCAALCDCISIVENVTNMITNYNVSKSRNSWENFVIKRCIWVLGKWVVDDPNTGTISMDRIASASQWCFKIAQLSPSVMIKIEVVLFIEHIIEALDKMPSDFNDTPIMHEIFLNPSISIVVSLLDITSLSDTHARLIEILIKLLITTNMWNNIELVKACANAIYNLWNGIKWPSKETTILRDRLLECLTTIVRSCNPVVIQPILGTLSIFINDSMELIIQSTDKCSKNTDNCFFLLDNTLQLWHEIIYNCEVPIEGLDNIYSLIVSDVLDTELDKNQTTLLLEIIQAHFLLKVTGTVNKESFSSLTYPTWSYIINQNWDPKHEEDLCVMRIQLFDLWLLGFQQSSLAPIATLMEIGSYCRFLCERTKELFTSTNEEPSHDQHVCIVNSTLTVLARICLFDRSILKNLLLYLSNGQSENQQLVVGLLNRWLSRIDNQSSCSIQQLFVLACIQWLPCCFEIDTGILSTKLETLINSCIQICSYTPYTNMEQNTELAKSTSIPAERHLRLAYILWNPLSNTSEIKKLVTSFMAGLNNFVGLENFQNSFSALDPIVQKQFIQLCTTTN